MDGRYIIYGALGSPYSMKMRALMRYRRLAHVWIAEGARSTEIARTKVKAPVIPVFEYPDGTFHNDSTPLIHDLERRHPGDRSVIPDDPADAFLAALIEDFADEWLTKAMFHYRWFRERDQIQMSRWLAFDSVRGGDLAAIEGFAEMFRARQVGRMALVGCTAENQALIETTTRRFLAALNAHVTQSYCFFGTRPSLAEFAVFGQVSQLGVDPTPQEMMRADYPYAFRWLLHADDMSGLDGAWRADGGAETPFLRETLALIGDVYLPFLTANARAAAAGAETFSFESRGMGYTQGVFKYQIKCLAALRGAYEALAKPAKTKLAAMLGETGCLDVLASKTN